MFQRLITLMVKAASNSEMSANFYQSTQYNNPEDSHLHTRCCEHLKSHILIFSSHLYLGLPSGIFPSGFPTIIL
jgi:hypothetical protein